MTYEPHIQDYKKKEVADVERLFNEYPVVGIINMEGLPTKMLQKMKKTLSDKVELKFTKKRFMKIAIDNIQDKKNIEQLKEKLVGIPALMFTKEEPFTIAKLIEKSKSSAPAKPGQVAPSDLSITAGPTPFTPGPMIGELGQLGIKTEVKEGKIHIRDDKVLVKEGEVIKPKVAELLAKLNIEPMKVGLNLLLTYQNGEILTKDVLYIDEEQYINDLKTAHIQSLALAMHVGIINKDTTKPLVQKAYRESKAVADKTNLLTPEKATEKVAEAKQTAVTLKEKVLYPPKEEPQEEAKPAENLEQEPPKEPEPEEQPKEEHPSPDDENPPPPPEEPQEEMKEPEPVEEQPREPTPPEPDKEAPKEEAVSEQKPEVQESPKEEKKEAPQPEQVIESKEVIKDSDMEVAEKFLKDLTTRSVSVEGAKKFVPKPDSEQDMNKLINKLKDKKSKGEI
jgi:large subunit ribosomal protein L10